ncbi:MAG: hypothetical protein BroJett038_28780 [Chloroflexota bacterium]|nr:MAG: hypothetical protein BroJett038_28780 [Chloroflexota bacterium]
MFNNHEYLNHIYHNHRHQELMRRAERKHLLRQLSSGRPAAIRFYKPILALLGHWMVLSGTYLQRKSGALADSSRTAAKPIKPASSAWGA